MFERFTSEARRVVVVAQEEAREARAAQIGPQYLLLGIGAVDGPGGAALRASGADQARLREAVGAVGETPVDPLDADALSAFGIDLRRVREKVEAAFGAGALDPGSRRKPASGHLPFAAASKHALEQALRAALRRGDRSIDSGHVLVGVLTVSDPGVTEVLRRLDIHPDQLRRRLDGDSDAA